MLASSNLRWLPPNSHYQLLVTGDLLKQINQRRYEIGWCYLDLSGYPGWPPGRSFFQRSASWWTPVYTKCLVAWLMEQGQGSWIRICPKTWDSRKHAHLLFIFQLWQSCARFANKESVVTSKGFQLNQEHQEGMSQININSQFVCRRSTISMKIERRLQEPFNLRDSRYCMFLCVIVRVAPISASGRSAKKRWRKEWPNSQVRWHWSNRFVVWSQRHTFSGNSASDEVDHRM